MDSTFLNQICQKKKKRRREEGEENQEKNNSEKHFFDCWEEKPIFLHIPFILKNLDF